VKQFKFARPAHILSLNWSKVMYLEELIFNYIRALRAKVRRHEGASRYSSKYIMNTVRLLGSVMVWGCFSSSVGCGRLYF
jgi:hypothetical protein